MIEISFTNNEIILRGALTQQTVQMAVSKTLSLLDGGKTITVNLAQISRCDSASLAYLMVLLREGRKREKHFLFVQIPKMMQELIKVSGIKPFL